MPNIILRVSKVSCELLRPHVHDLGLALRLATVTALKDLTDASEVEVFLETYELGDNACQVQIFTFASQTPEREARLPEWRKELAQAWTETISRLRLSENFPPGEVEVWPTTSPGLWGSIPLKE